MLANFDIFKRLDEKGSVRWCGASETLEEAKSKVKALGDTESEFVIFNQRTQESTMVTSETAACDKEAGRISL